ncbi:hypothetical protein N7453_004326 [Penicillium expansum]|nr:hypothetical protein N7453_004326 [Penicillium expansum]
MPEILLHVENPLGEAAAWIGGGDSRPLTSFQWKYAKFNGYDGVCGIDGVLAGNVQIQMRYDWDPDKGFHVNATKKDNTYAFIYRGSSNVGVDMFNRAMRDLNERKRYAGSEEAAATFMRGII